MRQTCKITSIRFVDKRALTFTEGQVSRITCSFGKEGDIGKFSLTVTNPHNSNEGAFPDQAEVQLVFGKDGRNGFPFSGIVEKITHGIDQMTITGVGIGARLKRAAYPKGQLTGNLAAICDTLLNESTNGYGFNIITNYPTLTVKGATSGVAAAGFELEKRKEFLDVFVDLAEHFGQHLLINPDWSLEFISRNVEGNPVRTYYWKKGDPNSNIIGMPSYTKDSSKIVNVAKIETESAVIATSTDLESVKRYGYHEEFTQDPTSSDTTDDQAIVDERVDDNKEPKTMMSFKIDGDPFIKANDMVMVILPDHGVNEVLRVVQVDHSWGTNDFTTKLRVQSGSIFFLLITAMLRHAKRAQVLSPTAGGYVLRDGSLPMTANWEMGNYTLTAAGITIDGTFTDGTMSIASGALSSVTTIGCGAITSTSTGVFQGASVTVGTTAQAGTLILYDGSNHAVTIDVPGIAASYTLSLPTTDGGANQLIKTDGSGNLSYSTVTENAGALAAITTITCTGAITDGTYTSDGTGNFTAVGTITATGELDITVASAPLIDLNPGFTTGGNVIDITPSAIIGTAGDWDAIKIDGSVLSPSVADVEISGVDIDFSGMSLTNAPLCHAINALVPAPGAGTECHIIRLIEGQITHFLTTSTAAAHESHAYHITVDATNQAANGIFHALQVDAPGTTVGDVTALSAGNSVEIIHQHVTTWSSFDQTGADAEALRVTSGPTYTAGVDGNECFVANGDAIWLCTDSGTYDALEVVMGTAGTKDIHATFWYLDENPAWVEFFPDDGTEGFTHSGVIEWGSAGFTDWDATGDPAVGSGEEGYWIRILRTRNADPGTPTPTTIKYASAVTNYTWDDSGILSCNTATFAGASVTIGTASATTGSLILNDSNSANAYTVTIPDITAGAVSLTLPATDGDNLQFLQTNGSGALTWATGLINVVEDTTPQLGGSLDLQNKDLTTEIAGLYKGDLNFKDDKVGAVPTGVTNLAGTTNLAASHDGKVKVLAIDSTAAQSSCDINWAAKQDGTHECWFQSTDVVQNHYWYFYSGATTKGLYRINIADSNFQHHDGAWGNLDTPVVAVVDTWYHLRWTLDNDGNNLFYINGVLKDTTAAPNAGTNQTTKVWVRQGDAAGDGIGYHAGVSTPQDTDDTTELETAQELWDYSVAQVFNNHGKSVGNIGSETDYPYRIHCHDIMYDNSAAAFDEKVPDVELLRSTKPVITKEDVVVRDEITGKDTTQEKVTVVIPEVEGLVEDGFVRMPNMVALLRDTILELEGRIATLER